jgi:DNA-binding MarR family transcriptional regulator/GNAT superfamily N-acetyltransferase
MPSTVDRIRRFNRTWTEVLGLLDRGLAVTEFSLVEARVLLELSQRPAWERHELRDRLGMDASFLSRVTHRLADQGLVESIPSETDRRALVLRLTDTGRASAQALDQRSAEQIADLVIPLTDDQRAVLVESMSVVAELLAPEQPEESLSFRTLRPGDLGWVVERHGALYADEFGWDMDFEAMVARVVADFHESFEPGRDNAWIAEIDGARAGCVFCCQRDDDTAQLRLLLVEPWARGRDLGRRLVDQCIDFAGQAGYTTLVLWTNDVLAAARRIYQTAGFELVDQESHHSFGRDLIGQTWSLDLAD